MPPPTLIVVGGAPGSGKTTLAHAIARAIPCPAICRDEIREGLGAQREHDAASLQTYAIFFDIVRRLLTSGVTLVAEAAFQHKLWAPKLEPLLEIADVRVIECHVDARVARERIAQRLHEQPHRRLSHADEAFLASAPDAYEPLSLDVPTLVVDTGDGYAPPFETILDFVR